MNIECDYSKYVVYANFYGEDCKSRLFADVIRKGFEMNKTDAYLVLINPGSCHNTKETVEINTGCYAVDTVTETVSDPAMKCVMRFMELSEIHKIRILNLIDYREPDLQTVIEKIGKNEIHLSDSIFSDKRRNEFERLTSEDVPYIIAWGMDKKLNEYKEQAYKRINAKRIYGIRSDGEYAYRYIKPWKKVDQDNLIVQLAQQFRKDIEIKDCRQYIRQEVHRLYWEHDTNCARTTMHCLSGLLDIIISEQTWDAAVGMHGAGGFRAQCGLVEGGLMFLGIYCGKIGIKREEAVKICYRYASSFQENFGALRCRELRPTGFSENDPPHMCEDLTCKAIEFTYDYIRTINGK